MNYLMCSIGRRVELLTYFKKTLPPESNIVATDNGQYAPALYVADKSYVVPNITHPDYIDTLIDICKKEHIHGILTFIDPEIALLAKHRDKFEALGIAVLVPFGETAAICFDKYKMFQHLQTHGIPTIMTWGSIADFDVAYRARQVDFPVFVKPRTGSGSIGAQKIDTYEALVYAFQSNPALIVQPFMQGVDLDADVYIDTISHKAVSAFTKEKIEKRIGGASKTISFIDEKLFAFIQEIVSVFQFNGPVDMDFFYQDGQYMLTEINPRFGGAYLHAYAAGVDFIQLMERNLSGMENPVRYGDYEADLIMMMYDSIVVKKVDEILL